MTTEENGNPTPPEQPSWFIDEGVPGVGNRPAWLPDKFKTVADLAKSNAELEKRLGTAPEEYDFSKNRYIDPEYEPLHDLKKLAKDKRVPQEVMDKMFETFDKYIDEFSSNPADELKKLGDNAESRVNKLDNWVKATVSKDAYEAISNSMTNAGAILALEELRGKVMSNVTQVPNNNGEVSQAATVADIQKEIVTNLKKYKEDAAYQKDIQNRLAVAVKASSTGYVDKTGA